MISVRNKELDLEFGAVGTHRILFLIHLLSERR